MAAYKPKLISLTKGSGQTFGFYLRVEHGEEGHLIRCLELRGPAEMAGMKDGDRILRVNGRFVDDMSHSQVVELVRNSGSSVTFHTLSEASYKRAKEQGVDLSDPQNPPVTNGVGKGVANGVAKHSTKPKLCYLVKSSSGFGFSIRSVTGQQGLFMTQVTPGGVAERAGVRGNDRLVEVNGENVEGSTHEQVVEKIKQAGDSLMFLLVDEDTYKHYQSKHIKVQGRLATVNFLPRQPRIISITKGSDGYGFLLKGEPNQEGHFLTDIDRGSPAEKAGVKDMDRLVAVDGNDVDGCTHEQVVDRIRQSGNKCCLLVVDQDTDRMYKQGKVSPMLFLDLGDRDTSPPSYKEALTLPTPARPATPRLERREEELKPKLCKMEKTAAGFGFHLNGIQGVHGQHIKEVVKGGVADQAGLEDDDVVVEVNGKNVEGSTHEEVVAMIRSSGSSLEMLVASKSVYDQLKAKGVTITPLLLGDTSYAEVHHPEEPAEAPTEPARERTPSVSSTSSDETWDEKL